jgi:hypothetical protein
MATWVARIISFVVLLLGSVSIFDSNRTAAQDSLQWIDVATTNQVLPYAYMSQDVYFDTASLSIPGGWSRIRDDPRIAIFNKDAASSGFYAAVYKNDKGDITIAYRGTASIADLEADAAAQKGTVPEQYKRAVQFANLVKQWYRNAPSISTTGHSLGGGKAAYVSQQTSGIANVITFDSARPPIVSGATAGRTKQINVVVPGEVVGDPKTDPKTGQVMGLGSLSGRTVYIHPILADRLKVMLEEKGVEAVANTLVPGVPVVGKAVGKTTADLFGTHRMQVVIDALSATKESSTAKPASKQTAPEQVDPFGRMAGTTPSTAQPNIPSQSPLPKSANVAPASKTPASSPSQANVSAKPSVPAAAASSSKTAAQGRASPKQQPASQHSQSSSSTTTRSAAITPSTQANTASYAPRSAFAFARPGGISFSEAAAAAMPIDIDLDGVYYRDGKLIISGRRNSTQVLDAALVLTALRASCEAGDPYFSLDPDNGPAWSAESHSATERLWERVKKDVGWETPVKADRRSVRSRSLFVHTIWGRRDYPQLWNSITNDYPNLKSRLVFRPAWLQQTRFGEILYKADVLLKEISSGISVLEPGALRSAKIDSYVSQLSRSNARTLFAGLRDQKIETRWRESRFWFDIEPRQSNTPAPDILAIRSASDRELFNTLKERKLVATGTGSARPPHQVAKDSEAETLDLSSVFPTMFVRRHDISRGIDIPDDDPIMNSLSADVNDNIQKYVGAYKELQGLTEIVRAYIAAVHVVKGNDSICNRIEALPLLDSEKTAQALPTHHPSEIMMSVQRYTFGTGQTVRAQATVVLGGVTIAGKQFYEAGVSGVQTTVIANLKREVALIPNTAAIKSLWEDNSGRQFIVLNLNEDTKLTRKPQQSSQPGSKTSSDARVGNTITEPPNEIEIENEPPAAQLPWWRKWLERRN